MEGKDNERVIDIIETTENARERELDRELEQATTAVTFPSTIRSAPSPSNTLGNSSPRVYSNSHHTQVRRSTDDREEDLLLESDENRRMQHEPSDSWHCMDVPPAQAEPILVTRDEFFSRTSSNGQLDELVQSIVQPLENPSLQSTTTPQQESCGRDFDNPPDSGCFENSTHVRRTDCVDFERFRGDQESSHAPQKLCMAVLFKRGIIARDELIHVLYIIPYDDFQKKFPKIKQYEAVVCHATEFPMGEENQPMSESSLYHRIIITDIVSVYFEMVHGGNFSIVCPCKMTAHVSQICSRSEDRIGCGFSVTVLTRCTGGKDNLFEDSIRMKLHSGNTTLHLVFPIAYYEANVSPWLYDSQAVTAMPKEDREVLRSCHVPLLENIGDVISVCEHLYQHKILDGDDLEEIRNITKKRDRNAHVLRTIQTRGNILDLVIEIMRGKRENQEAAAILQRKRFQQTDM